MVAHCMVQVVVVVELVLRMSIQILVEQAVLMGVTLLAVEELRVQLVVWVEAALAVILAQEMVVAEVVQTPEVHQEGLEGMEVHRQREL